MPVINELISSEKDGTLSFGNYKLDTKSKLSDFEHCGDSYKVKTFKEITKLERNGSFVYESVPGTAVMNFKAADTGLSFTVEGSDDAQITVELEEFHRCTGGAASGVHRGGGGAAGEADTAPLPR